MKSLIPLLLLAVMAIVGCQSNKENTEHQHGGTTATAPADTTKKSIPRDVHAQVGKAHIMMHYYAPAVRGRTIWGGLVPYNEVWVTGAHNATSFETNTPLLLGGKELPAGKYAFFTIPGEKQWTVVLNKNWEQHLADEYDPKDDVLRVDVTPEVREAIQERLTYQVAAVNERAGNVYMRWEKMLVSLPFEVR